LRPERVCDLKKRDFFAFYGRASFECSVSYGAFQHNQQTNDSQKQDSTDDNQKMLRDHKVNTNVTEAKLEMK
jgi:hypothetical protein